MSKKVEKRTFIVGKNGKLHAVKSNTSNIKKLLKNERYHSAYNVWEYSHVAKFLLVRNGGNRMKVIENDERNVEKLINDKENEAVYRLWNYVPTKKEGTRKFLVISNEQYDLINVEESDIQNKIEDKTYQKVYSALKVDKVPDRRSYYVVQNITPGITRRPRYKDDERQMKRRTRDYRKRQTLHKKMEGYTKISEGVRGLIFLDYVGETNRSFFTIDSNTKRNMEESGKDPKELGVIISHAMEKHNSKDEDEDTVPGIDEEESQREKEALDAMMELQTNSESGNSITTELITKRKKRKRKPQKRRKAPTHNKRNKPNE